MNNIYMHIYIYIHAGSIIVYVSVKGVWFSHQTYCDNFPDFPIIFRLEKGNKNINIK